MRRPASELFAPLEEYYPRRCDYTTDASHGDALDIWGKGGDPQGYLVGMTPQAKRRFPLDSVQPVTPATESEPIKTKYNFDLYGGAICALLAILCCAPALAQDTSTMSDDGLRQEMDRVGSHAQSNAKLRGYGERVTATDYELEFQMKQIDERMKADD